MVSIALHIKLLAEFLAENFNGSYREPAVLEDIITQ